MNPSVYRVLSFVFFAVSLSAFAQGRVTARHGAYHGWRTAQFLSNGKAEVVIVPEVGRVMQFRFAGEDIGPFWENRALDGKSPNAKTNVWGNFGGDKTWPAPQADWPKLTQRAWPPPVAFDSMPAASLDLINTPAGVVVVMRTPVDPHYGIRAARRIELSPRQPVLTITTTYEKVQGDPVKVAVWVITHLENPLGIYLPVPKNSIHTEGYALVMKGSPPSLKVERGLVSLRRDPMKAFKIGNDAESLLWVGERQVVRIDTPRARLAEYTHQGNSAEVYTNPDTLPYVELETLGPVATLKAGDTLTQTNTYTLSHRSQRTPESEARKILGL
ncbi:MAG: hypothetical protein HY300_02730 [Verrucomicrobia bacterium]|nr:hypothetical protein [Verrucomicrobiota bacterium]